MGPEPRVIVVFIYSLIIFFLLYFHGDIPREYRKFSRLFYTFIEYRTFAFVFWYSISNKPFKIIILILSIGFTVFQIIDYFSNATLYLDSVPIGIETILVFIYSFFFLYEEFRKIEAHSLISKPVFWLVGGIVFYLAGSFFFNILANNFTNEQFTKYWFYSYLFDDIKNILFVISMFLFAKQQQKKPKKTEPYLDIDHQIINN